jgi:hypothetical protein
MTARHWQIHSVPAMTPELAQDLIRQAAPIIAAMLWPTEEKGGYECPQANDESAGETTLAVRVSRDGSGSGV